MQKRALLWGLSLITTAICRTIKLGGQHPIQSGNISVKAPLLKSTGRSPKYFREASFHPHYDRRFGRHVLSYNDQKYELKNLLQTYLSTFADLGLETWLMHGSLLGWWWNKQIMPWDSDVDVQVTEATMFYLAAYYNMSVWHYQTPRIPDGRNYLLDINPAHKNPSATDKLNRIDARWIDMKTGLFIDITSVRYNLSYPEGAGILSCKDGHEFKDTYIFPLRDTTFETAPVKIPYRYRDLLVAEYGEKSLTNKDFRGHLFDEKRMEWVPKPDDAEPPMPLLPVEAQQLADGKYKDKTSRGCLSQEEKRKNSELKAIEKARLREEAWEKRRLARLKASVEAAKDNATKTAETASEETTQSGS